MKTYARIQDGRVAELFLTDGDITTMFHPSLVWVDVTDIVSLPACGWTATQTGGVWSFAPPPAPPAGPTTAAVDAIRDLRLATGFADATTGKTWQCRPQDTPNWGAIAASAGLNVLRGAPYNAATYDLIAADNTTVTLSAADASALLEGRVMPWVSRVMLYARSLKDQILAGGTPDINSGWP